MQDVIVGIDRDENDGKYDVNIFNPSSTNVLHVGGRPIRSNCFFVGSFDTRPKAMEAAVEYCSNNNWNILEYC